MARAREKPSSEFEIARAKIEQKARYPLRKKPRERFAQAYAASFDGPASARAAGYGKPSDKIWQALLGKPEVQARLRALIRGPRVPPPVPKAVFERILEQAFGDHSSLMVQNPLTGEMEVALSRATPDQLNSFRVRVTERRRGSCVDRSTVFETTPRSKALEIVALRLGLRTLWAGMEERNPLADAFAEISRRGSPFPIAQRYKFTAPGCVEE